MEVIDQPKSIYMFLDSSAGTSVPFDSILRVTAVQSRMQKLTKYYFHFCHFLMPGEHAFFLVLIIGHPHTHT